MLNQPMQGYKAAEDAVIIKTNTNEIMFFKLAIGKPPFHHIFHSIIEYHGFE